MQLKKTSLLGLLLLMFLFSVIIGAAELLPDGGFEAKNGWVIADFCSKISGEQVYSGKLALKITDVSEQSGSSVTSNWFPLEPGQIYTVRCAIRTVTGAGVGLYLRYYDRERKPLIKQKEHLWQLPMNDLGWKRAEWAVKTPTGAAFGRIWIHSYNASLVTVYLDDLSLTRGGVILNETGRPERPYSTIDLARLKFKHPRLILTPEQLPALRERINRLPWAQKIYKSLIANSEKQLGQALDFPERGGQWYHWYACPKHGAGLIGDSPTRHRCPVGGEVSSGEPYDSSYLHRVHQRLAQTAEELATAYLLTDKEAYAQKVVDILLGYAKRYPGYPLHDKYGKAAASGGKAGCQTLDEANWVLPLARAYDAVRGSGLINKRERQLIEADLLRAAADLIIGHDEKLSNRQSWSNAALTAIGLAIEEPSYLEIAINSPRGFQSQLANGVLDGLWWEGSWGYHFYALQPLFSLAQMMANYGYDLFATPNLKAMLDAPLSNGMPDLMLPGFHDNEAKALNGYQMLYELGYARYQDPRYAVVFYDRSPPTRSYRLEVLIHGADHWPEAGQIRLASANFPEAGYAVLRSGEGPGATYLALDYGPHGGSHGHSDKLGFVFYSRGKLWLYDPGSVQYGLPENAGWYKRSLAHNVMMVGGKNQGEATGQCLRFDQTPELSMVRASAGPVYPGVQMERTAILVGERLILVDRLEAAAETSLDWVFHSQGLFETDLNLLPTASPESIEAAFKYVSDWKVSSESGLQFNWVWRQERSALYGSLASKISGKLWTGKGYGRKMSERWEFPFLRFRGVENTVCTVFSPDPVKVSWEGERIRLESAAGVEILYIDNDGKYKIAWNI